MSKTKIVSCEGTEEDAIEAVKRLNEILDAYSDQKLEEYKERLKARFKDWFEEEDDEITVATIFKTIDEGDKEYGTELSLVDTSDKQLNTLLDKVETGIVATGIPEAGRHYEYGDVCGKCGSPCGVGPRGLYCPKCEPHRSGEPVQESGEKPEITEEQWQKYIDEKSKEPQNSTNRDWYWYLRGLAEGYGQAEFEGHKRGDVSPPSQADRDSQEELWKEAINLYSKRDHSADGRADMMKEFTITRNTKP